MKEKKCCKIYEFIVKFCVLLFYDRFVGFWESEVLCFWYKNKIKNIYFLREKNGIKLLLEYMVFFLFIGRWEDMILWVGRCFFRIWFGVYLRIGFVYYLLKIYKIVGWNVSKFSLFDWKSFLGSL